MRMRLKISQARTAVGAALLGAAFAATVLGAAPAGAQTIPVPAPPTALAPPAPLPPPPPPAPSPPGEATPAPAPPPGGGPTIDLPPEVDMPTTGLPRETAIENPLGRAPAISGTAVGGYGELTLNAPSNGPAIVDLRRFVLYVGHHFTDRIRFYSEVEVEHAIASAEDLGEVEIEQAYLDGLLTRRLNLRAGLI